ncbi:hypothetical protein G7K_1449-t1 [Saitoella complicata NRRL Y-17804]|uniref:DUF7918 domain-containing protein n=1 Tax=Saitoella complicata (strain BCRC 22490 / CBS 7301 / JCM 7358 / NBRC 10748 / NRRL Y-17804) TaxID=698492 RepID=A0A0E9NBM2_SAICN|nr:hypothetical protein G7K_1449-t1 [Saitoella complicata NRRL Y-17804]
MISYRGFSAQVLCGSIPLTEYQIQYDEEGRTVTCFIESEPGKEYSVKSSWQGLDPDHKHHDAIARLYVDGIKITPGKYLHFTPNSCRSWLGEQVNPQQSGLSFSRKFVQQVHDRDHCETNVARVENLGTIKVLLYHCTETVPDPVVNYTDFDATKPIDERKMKAIKVPEHCTEVAPKEFRFACTVHDRHPYVTFVFKYRSRDFLEIKGIIPGFNAELQALAPNHKRERSGTLTGEEEVEVIRRQVRKLEAEKARMKEREIRLRGEIRCDLTGEAPVEKTVPAAEKVCDIVDLTEDD